MFAKELQGFNLGFFADKEGNVVVASTVGNHSYRNLLQCVDYHSLEATVLPFKVAHHTHDNHVGINRHVAEFL